MAEKTRFPLTWGILREKKTEREPGRDMDFLKSINAAVDENLQNLKRFEEIERQGVAPPFMINDFKERLQKGESVPSDFLAAYETPGAQTAPKAGSVQNNPEIVKDDKKKPDQLLDLKIMKTLAADMKTRVFGQDEAIDEIVDVLKAVAAKVNINKEKPAGCYFLAGPSGCGKTEAAISLPKGLSSEQCEIPLLVINCGEYGMENDVTKLIGPPPGYKGNQEGGVLTNFVRENPFCGILLDEVEKAHPSFDKILLSIMDKGVCGDSNGKPVDFKNTIIMATSNLGAEVEYEEGFSKEQKDSYRMGVIKQSIRPEIINRYDCVVHFNAITRTIYGKILDKFLKVLDSGFKKEHGIDLKFSKTLVDWSIDSSYDPAMGGRPARRFIEKIIMKPLVDEIINQTFDGGHKIITMDINKPGNVVFKSKTGKVLGELKNTKQLVARVEDAKFIKKPKM